MSRARWQATSAAFRSPSSIVPRITCNVSTSWRLSGFTLRLTEIPSLRRDRDRLRRWQCELLLPLRAERHDANEQAHMGLCESVGPRVMLVQLRRVKEQRPAFRFQRGDVL